MIAFHILAFYALIQCTFSGSGKTHAVATRFKIDASWAKVLDVKPPQTIITLGPIYNFSKITGEEMCDLILERISLAKKPTGDCKPTMEGNSSFGHLTLSTRDKRNIPKDFGDRLAFSIKQGKDISPALKKAKFDPATFKSRITLA